jgi:hypothetical protein
VSDHSHTDEEFHNLQTLIVDLQNQFTDLNSQLVSLEAPRLIEVNLKSGDNRPYIGTPYLHVYGEICNVGFNTAYNCSLHIVAYQGSYVLATDTHIPLGSISGQSWISIDSQAPYAGGSLINWTITPEWKT